MFHVYVNDASTCDYSTFLDRALKEQFTVGLCSKETQLKLLSKEHSLAESISKLLLMKLLLGSLLILYLVPLLQIL